MLTPPSNLLQVLETVEECARDASSCESLEGLDQRQAEQLLMLHTDSMGAVQQEALQQLRTGHEIMQVRKIGFDSTRLGTLM